jgi:hypothetical protein
VRTQRGALQITKGLPLAPLAAARPPGKGSGRISEDLGPADMPLARHVGNPGTLGAIDSAN